jgi:SAM-dependent methyltransferase
MSRAGAAIGDSITSPPQSRESAMERLTRCDLCGGSSLRTIDSRISLCRCDSCGFVFRNPRPNAAAVGAFYSAGDHYDPWLEEELGRDALWKRRLRMLRRYRDGGSLLDVGTGIGQFLYWARNYFDVEGTEVSESGVRTALEKYHLQIHRGSLDAVDFGARTFDVITMFHVLEHVPSPSAALRRCRELLHPAGLLVIAVPNELHSWKTVAKRMLLGSYGLPELTLDSATQELHLSHFTVGTLTELLRRSGFSVMGDGLDPFYAATGIRRLLPGTVYDLCWAAKALTGQNFYDTIWMVAKKA